MQVAHCGICHSDLHQILNEWKNTKFPCLPGHEITGIVTSVGDSVTKFKVPGRRRMPFSGTDLLLLQRSATAQLQVLCRVDVHVRV